ncbi:GDP-L-fucose synthase [Candidatus Pacearchaeota archaeon]|nr:GDP-L-fucose synthase [Candidatus Pacearchaeota archaeon]
MEKSLHDQKIIVTGGSGFLGSALIRKLEAAGAQKKNIMIPRSKEYDLTKDADITRMLDSFNPDIIIHLAAKVGGIGYNMKNPGSLYYDNLMMGAKMIEHSRLKGVKKFVAVSTICAYPKFTPVPFKEDDLWIGYPEETNAPYGLAKKMMLVQLQSYKKQYNFHGIYLLPVNLYGPGDNFNPESSHVIPALIKKFVDAVEQKKDKVEVWGTGKASREFLYVDDAADAIVKATMHYEKEDPVNLGSGMEITIKDLVNTIAKIMDFKGSIVWDATKPDGQPRRCLDVSRAEKEFGFKAKTSFEEGLKHTIDWYMKNKNNLVYSH